MSSIDDGMNPPFPENKEDAVGDSESSEKGSGQRLLALVRLIEKTSDLQENEYEKNMEDAVDLFNYLIALYSRRGLLQGNMTKADKILSTLKSKTRERGSKGKSNGKLTNSDANISAGFQQEFLVFTALVRVLSSTNLESNKYILDDDHALVIALAAELCVAICQYIHRSKEDDACIHAEYELLMQSGKALLSGIVSSLKSIERDVQMYTKSVSGQSLSSTEKCLVVALLDHDKHIDPINSCLKAASSLVSLFGTKLSRSTNLLSDLKSVAWKFLTMNENSIQCSAARVIAIIPMAGGTDRMMPSDIWNRSMTDTISMMSSIMNTMAPLNKSGKKGDAILSEEARIALQTWVTFVREDVSEESARVLSFRRFLGGLTLCFQSLVSRDGMNGHDGSPLSDAKVDVESILEVIETLVSFPLSAETIFYKTKKRLRNEAVDGGLLSPRAASILLGNQIKKLGHSIFDCLLQSLGGSTLLPFSTRITRMAYASLLTSCSGPLRKVLDPTSGLRLDGKKRKWLHTSIPMRLAAIDTVKIVVTLFGNGKRDKFSPSTTSRNDAEKAIALAAGCFVEEIAKGENVDGPDDSWGTFRERGTLIVASLECLQAALVSCGGFLSIPMRSMIDSTVLTGLRAMDKQKDLLSSSAAKTSMFELTSCCITTPWNDGSCSSLSNSAILVSKKYESDMDAKVCIAAKAVLRVCGTIAVPRAPALLYVSRAVAADTSVAAPADQTGRDLLKKIQTARNEILQAEKANESIKRKKAEENRRREAEEEEAKASKRKKTEAHEILRNKSKTPSIAEPTNSDKSNEQGGEEAASAMEVEAIERVPGEHSRANRMDAPAKDEVQGKAANNDSGNESVNKVREELIVPKVESKQVTTSQNPESDAEFDFPDIVEGGGPDSDDE